MNLELRLREMFGEGHDPACGNISPCMACSGYIEACRYHEMDAALFFHDVLGGTLPMHILEYPLTLGYVDADHKECGGSDPCTQCFGMFLALTWWNLGVVRFIHETLGSPLHPCMLDYVLRHPNPPTSIVDYLLR